MASGSVVLPFEISLGGIWTLRSAVPLSARAGRDLNADGVANTDYVPGTTRNQGRQGSDSFLAAVNAWRAQNGRTPIPESQIANNDYNRFDLRASKAVTLGTRRVEFIAQVFNLFGRDNYGVGVTAAWQSPYQENTLSDAFGRILEVQPRQQAELAVRFTF